MTGGKLALATFALSMGSFMNILDLSIANVSIPTIAGDLGVGVNQGTWVITSYAVSEAIMLPLTGWLALRFGQIRLFVVATLLFTLASLACGLAFTFPMLLAARVVQGIVGASMIPLSQSLITTIYPPHQRGLALGIWSMTTIVSPVVGPLVGGWLTENQSWHWVFLINLPIGLLVAFMVSGLFAHRESPTRKVPVDFTGLGLLIVGVGALQILLDKGNELDWFGSTFIISMACLAVFALALFVVWELYEEHPVVDIRLFASRNFTVGVVCLMLGTMAWFGTVIVLPLWLQTYNGYTAVWAGKTMAFGGMLTVLLGPIVGANLNRFDPRAIASVGFIMFGTALFWSARFTPDVDFWSLALNRLFIGMGISFFFMPLTIIHMSGLAPDRMASAAGLGNFMRIIGSSFGTAILTSMFEHKAIQHHAELAEQISIYNPNSVGYLESLQAGGLTAVQAYGQTENTLNVQAYLMSMNGVFFTCGMIMFSLLLLVWWAKPPFGVKVGR